MPIAVILMIQSDSEFCVVGLEVELLSRWGEGAWDFLVEVVKVVLELALALVGGEIEGESLAIANNLAFLLVEPLAVVLVDEVPASRTEYLSHASFRSNPKFWISSNGLILGTTDRLASGVMSE